jgi:YidC/Oxa1 family membrane protein insertase
MQQHSPHHKEDQRNLMLALVLTLLVLVGWRFFAPPPPVPVAHSSTTPQETMLTQDVAMPSTLPISRDAALTTASRIRINSSALHGSIDLKGLRLDDVTLARYHETIEKDSPEIVLLTPRIKGEGYFTAFGWVGDGNTTLPNDDTLWHSSHTELTPTQAVTFSWKNPEGVTFEVVISLDEAYMLNIEQRVINETGATIQVAPYATINRTLNADPEQLAIQHLGMIATHDNRLKEMRYSDIRDSRVELKDSLKWLGITDKYWLTALIPDAKEAQNWQGTIRHYEQMGDTRYQLSLQATPSIVAAGATASVTSHLFAGAKESALLANYSNTYDITLFDRAVDFGVLYFLTYPLLLVLQWLYALLGNFGLAIMGVTVLLKLLMFPLANKSYASMSQMKLLMPKMQEIKERFPDDRLQMNKAIMELYKQEKVNPASGCLPLLIQLPVFFALYKVLYIAIEMRHAPFYGWIKDLSVADPTNIFTLFGLLEWTPPSLLHIGVLPLLMSATMIIQQQMNPKPTDPVQAQVMTYMPYVFVFIFASFPAGLVLYWVWSNILSIAQQYLISRRYAGKYDKKTGKRLHKNG